MPGKNKNLHVVKQSEDPTDQIVEQIITELNSQEIPAEEIEEQVKRHKKNLRRTVIISVLAVSAIAVGVYLLIHLQTYTIARASASYPISGALNSSYEEFAGGVLKYSRDGISYLNQKGEEQWNHSYQIKNPFVEVCGKSAAVADKGGNDISVFQKDGLKGEIHTTLPIDKMAVSEQGIVSVVLKNESSPQVVCYDASGNILVEHKVSFASSGYPMDVCLSGDGTVMAESYLYTENGQIMSRLVYYNFGSQEDKSGDYQVASKEYKGTVIPDIFFLNGSTSVAAGDDRLIFYKGLDKPEEKADVKLRKEIKSVFHNDKYVGVVLQNEGKEGCELRLYNASGRMVMSKDFTGNYNNVKISGSQVIMYDGKKCTIFMRTGIRKFDGELNKDIMEIVPVLGVNQYIVINADGMEAIRLVK